MGELATQDPSGGTGLGEGAEPGPWSAHANHRRGLAMRWGARVAYVGASAVPSGDGQRGVGRASRG